MLPKAVLQAFFVPLDELPLISQQEISKMNPRYSSLSQLEVSILGFVSICFVEK